MKIKYIFQLVFLVGYTSAYAQWRNDTVVVNMGGLVCDWSVQAWNAANGSYSTEGSAGTPGNYGVFEHYGQSGNGNNSAFRNDGIYNASVNGRDYFKGPGNSPGQQGIGGTVAPVFGELFLQNGTGQPFDISNSNGADVAGTAIFANGITTTVRSTASTGALCFGDNATYINTAAGDAQYVNGYVTKSGDDAFTFPVGAQDGTDLRTLQISAPASISNTLSVAYWNGSAASGLDPTPAGTQSFSDLNPSGVAGIDKLTSVSPICFWDWVATSGTSSLTITVSLPSFTGTDGYSDASDIRLAGWNLNMQRWDNLSGDIGATGSHEGSTITGAVSDMSNYGAIAIGSVATSPLPVDILSFEGYMVQCAAHFKWTITEQSNISKFMIQYSLNGKNYSEIAEVGAGDYTFPNNYTYTMPDVPEGNALFRIKALYKDGLMVYYQKGLRLVSKCNANTYVRIAPNPTRDNIKISGLKGSNNLGLFDITGRKLYNMETVENEMQISLKNYPAGTYILKISGSGFNTVYEKIVKQ